LAPDFWAFAQADQELARLHPEVIERSGVPLFYWVEDKRRDQLAASNEVGVTEKKVDLDVVLYRCILQRTDDRNA
jgi:hypothetical protein